MASDPQDLREGLHQGMSWWQIATTVSVPALGSLLFKEVRRAIRSIIRKIFSSVLDDKHIECVSLQTFNAHEKAEAGALQTILGALDQNARVVESAAHRVEDHAKEMRENAQLIHLSQHEFRREIDGKMNELQRQVLGYSSEVQNLSGQVKVLIPLVQQSLNNGNGKHPA